jgi:predicted deacylase
MSEVFRVDAPYRGPYRLERLSFGSGSPTLAVVAGLHGNELNGILALNVLAATLRMSRLKGTVHVLPVVNTFGLEQGTKRWPYDDQDINQAFPGDPDGSVVQRIAHAVLECTQADVCLDVHSASPLMRELPQVRVPLSGAEVELGRAMGLPVVWRRAGERLESTGLVGAWRQSGRSALHVIGGRGATLDVDASRVLANGILRLLHHLEILPIAPDPGETVVDTTRTQVSYHYSAVGGFWVPEVRTGDRVKPGHVLGKITEVIGGDLLEEFRADREGIVVTMRTYPVVHARELLVRVAEPLEK